MKTDPLSYNTNTQSSQVKDFAREKDALRASNFADRAVEQVVLTYVEEKNIRRLSKVISERSILLSAPFSSKEGPKNTIPEYYAHELAKRLKLPVVSLNDYIRFDQNESSRKTYNVEERAVNDFLFQFKDSAKEERLKTIIFNKDVILIDDVITTGETLSHLSTYLNKRLGAKITEGHALVAVANSRPSDRDMQRFSEKIMEKIGNRYSMREILSRTMSYFEPYTRLKMVRFERMIVNPETAMSVLNTMDQDKQRIHKNLQKSIELPAGRSMLKDKDLDKEH